MSDLNKIFEDSKPNLKHFKTPDIDYAEFDKVITSRRSVRKFTTEAVPEIVIQKAIDHALLAPNSSNLQTWQFYWLKEKEKRHQMNKAFLSQPAATTAPELIVVVSRPDLWKKHSKQMVSLLEKDNSKHPALNYYKKIVPLFYSLGFFGVIGFLKKIFFFFAGFKRPIPREVTTRGELNTWSAKSAALACENLMLSLRAQGYDSCPMEGFDSKRVKSILKLPRHSIVVMGISAGKRAKDGVFGEQIRFNRKDFVFEV